jgi:hypothetical protein
VVITMKLIHTKKQIRNDLTYTRRVLAQIEKSITTGDWADVEDAAQELSAVLALIESRARDNRERIEDFDCKFADEIAKIREAEVARWQKIADRVCTDLTATTGIEWTGVAR